MSRSIARFGWFIFIPLAMPSALARADALTDRVEALLKSPGYEHAQWGLLVVDAKDARVVFERNADQMFCPASVTKLFSCAAALAELGADFRFHTPVRRRGEVGADGTLMGDLILVAQGDLCLGGRTGPEGELRFEHNDHTYAGGNSKATLVNADPLAGLDHLAREIAASGIKRVAGRVLVDDRLFEPASSTGSGPSRLTPIVINDNVVDVVVSPGPTTGAKANFKIVPETQFVSVDNVTTTGPGEGKTELRIERLGPRAFAIRGEIAASRSEVVKIFEIEEPASFARSGFIDRLRARGVIVNDSPLGSNDDRLLPSRDEVSKLPIVSEYVSPRLSEYLKVILKVSHNLYASTLPLIIAARHRERTLEDGVRREGQLLQSLGVPVDAISFGGGAGGSRSDLVSPRATVALLRSMAKRADFSSYEAALPILGRDGTLATAVSPESPARGHARAKTGTYWVGNALNGRSVLTSKALAGYLETSSGHPLVFAFFVNNVPLKASSDDVSDATAAAGRLLGALCEAFYEETNPGGSTATDAKGRP